MPVQKPASSKAQSPQVHEPEIALKAWLGAVDINH